MDGLSGNEEINDVFSFLQCEDPPCGQLEARPTPARRGHAHRRSGAISNHALSTILRPSTDEKGGSAPTSNGQGGGALVLCYLHRQCSINPKKGTHNFQDLLRQARRQYGSEDGAGQIIEWYVSIFSDGTSSSPSAASPRSQPEPGLEQEQVRARPSTTPNWI